MALVPSTSVGGSGSGGSTLLFYAEVTATVNTSATVEASAEALVSLGAQTYAAVATWIEFYCPNVTVAPAGGAAIATLWDVGTEVCRLGDFRGGANGAQAMVARMKFTPSAGLHTYNMRGFGVNPIAWTAGVGTGGAGVYPPMYLAAYTA